MSTADSATQRSFNAKRFLADQMRNIAPVFTLIALVVFFSFASSSFLTLDNALNIVRQLSITGIIAVGLTYVILTAEIDLSVAAVANAVGITVAYFTIQPDYVNIANVPVQGWIAIILALAAALAFGLVTAFGMTFIGIPSFIMTLAMMQIANGVSALLVRGQIAYQYPELITTLGSGTAFTIPLGVDAAGKAMFIPIGWTIIVCLIFLLAGHLVLKYTRYGRYVYMVGGNREAAEYSGIPVRRVETLTYVISALSAGIAGVCYAAYIGQMSQQVGIAYELYAIAAAVLGGVSLRGGAGTVIGAIIGSCIMRVIDNGINMFQWVYRDGTGARRVFRLDNNWTFIIIGAVILVAVVLDQVAHRIQSKRLTLRAALDAAAPP
jgi:ribose transport system permease protein